MSQFIIRADAGDEVGFGHVVRSLSLAKYLRAQFGLEAIFYSNPYPKLTKLYGQNGFEFSLNDNLSEIDFLSSIGKKNPGAIIFIDKLFPYGREAIRNLKQNLNIIMFQNECEGMYESDYAIFPSAHLSEALIQNPNWKNAPAKFLYGPDFVVINQEVTSLINQPGEINSHPYIAITTGASDPEGLLIKILEWINESKRDLPIRFLVGFDFCHRSKLEAMLIDLKPGVEVKEFAYSDLFAARLAISTFGVTTYELVYANVPVISIGHKSRNAIGSEALQNRYGCTYHLGLFDEVTKEQFESTILHFWNNEEVIAKMIRKQQGLIDGLGLERLAKIIYNFVEEKSRNPSL